MKFLSEGGAEARNGAQKQRRNRVLSAQPGSVAGAVQPGRAPTPGGVENSLRWRLDVVMNEDQDRTRMGCGPHNLARLRHMAINAMQKEASRGSLRGKFKRAGWDNDYRLRLLELF